MLEYIEKTECFVPWHTAEEVPAAPEACVVYYTGRSGMYRVSGYAKAMYGPDGWNLPAGRRVVSWQYLSLADLTFLREKPKKGRKRRKKKSSVWFSGGKPLLR